jgi:hypothetical protein
MESTVRSPQIGDDVIVIVMMWSGRITELGGFIQEISPGYAYFVLDSLDLGTGRDGDSPLERKLFPKNAAKLLLVGVPLEDLKPFDGESIDDEDASCWEVKI